MNELAAAVEAYFAALGEIRATGAGVPETSYYGALSALFDAVGKGLKPKVRCVLTLANRGAGLPDGGFFTARQFQRSSLEPLSGQAPERGVLEVKPPNLPVEKVADSEQARRYVSEYGLLLVTNLREFQIVGRDDQGRAQLLEAYRIAPDGPEFWRLVRKPREATREHGERLFQFLRRALLMRAPLASPEDVAWFLASYARDAKARIEHADHPALAALRGALEEALGVAFTGTGGKGERFFRSTLIQTLFYGVFSAWVLWHKERPGRTDRFEWRQAEWTLRVPMIRELFEQVAQPSRLEPLGLIEPLDWAAAALDRVDRAAFFSRFEEEQAVQYFYEPFLEAFDPELRKELGVWYTPHEIVRYMVSRVDAALKSELGLEDGLADPNVYVLDPCCGTGAFLVEVLRQIGITLEQKGGDALLAADLKRAAQERVFGFELLPAPFVVAHLQLGLVLQNLGAPLRKNERAGVFLTNALTGWEPLVEPGKRKVSQLALSFPELAHERDLANEVKRDRPILVILGNPPYNGFAGLSKIEEERDLTESYRTTVHAPAPQGQGLNDLFVRFFRMAERKIVEGTQCGVVSFISNYAWLDGLSYPGMRERYLEVFDRIWIDNLNGDKFKTGKLTPDGLPDPSVFSTRWNHEGIQLGAAISTLIRRANHAPCKAVEYRDFWGKEKRQELLASLEYSRPALEIRPALDLGFPFIPVVVSAAYLSWPRVPDLFPLSFPGVMTSRDDLVTDIDRGVLESRMMHYFDPEVSDEEFQRVCPTALRDRSRFRAREVREHLRKRGFLPEQVRRYHYQPFDLRWIYWEPETDLLDRKREQLAGQIASSRLFLTSRQKRERFGEGSPFLVFRHLHDRHLTRPAAHGFPLLSLPERSQQGSLFSQAPVAPEPNLSALARRFGAMVAPDLAPEALGEALMHHVLAVGHSPAFLAENDGGLWQDWPRIPLPRTAEHLGISAALGRRLAALLDLESPVSGVTTGNLDPGLRPLAVFSLSPGLTLDEDRDLAVTAGWGHPGKDGVAMPGQGRSLSRACSAAETKWLSAESRHILGEPTLDIYLNSHTFWKNVPAQVWSYTLGGYQILKKWLSYREEKLLGRPLRHDEVRLFTEIARRIAALLLLSPELDRNYKNVAAETFDPCP